eukprot:Lankesteria_metandrocarpae@DN3936_c0_g1_i2.p1
MIKPRISSADPLSVHSSAADSSTDANGSSSSPITVPSLHRVHSFGAAVGLSTPTSERAVKSSSRTRRVAGAPGSLTTRDSSDHSQALSKEVTLLMQTAPVPKTKYVFKSYYATPPASDSTTDTTPPPIAATSVSTPSSSKDIATATTASTSTNMSPLSSNSPFQDYAYIDPPLSSNSPSAESDVVTAASECTPRGAALASSAAVASERGIGSSKVSLSLAMSPLASYAHTPFAQLLPGTSDVESTKQRSKNSTTHHHPQQQNLSRDVRSSTYSRLRAMLSPGASTESIPEFTNSTNVTRMTSKSKRQRRAAAAAQMAVDTGGTTAGAKPNYSMSTCDRQSVEQSTVKNNSDCGNTVVRCNGAATSDDCGDNSHTGTTIHNRGILPVSEGEADLKPRVVDVRSSRNRRAVTLDAPATPATAATATPAATPAAATPATDATPAAATADAATATATTPAATATATPAAATADAATATATTPAATATAT